jgi:Protein of unknown function (DUF3313)
MFAGRLNSLWSLAALVLTGGCATVPFEQSGSLSSYKSLAASDGILTRARVSANKDELLAAKTIRIAPTSFSESASRAGLSQIQRDMVANAIDRSMCIGLADRFHVVSSAESADLSVHAVVTYVGLTDEMVAGVSQAAAVGVSVAEKIFIPVPVPIPTPRIPVGLGGLAVEAEALDQTARQQAAMVWARGADAFTSKPKVSTAADAYDVTSSFASDFSQLLVTGSSPFQRLPSLPSVHSISAMFGGPPKEVACEAFGRGPGVPGLLGSMVGLPPEWTDKGPPASPQTGEASAR